MNCRRDIPAFPDEYSSVQCYSLCIATVVACLILTCVEKTHVYASPLWGFLVRRTESWRSNSVDSEDGKSRNGNPEMKTEKETVYG